MILYNRFSNFDTLRKAKTRFDELDSRARKAFDESKFSEVAALCVQAKSASQIDFNKYKSNFNVAQDLQEKTGYITLFQSKQKNIEDDLNSAKNALPDPPVDVLAHSVQFTISYGAGINPVWSFAIWKGPGSAGSGTVLAAGANHQHTLNLVMGPASKKDDANRVLNNLVIQEAFRQ